MFNKQTLERLNEFLNTDGVKYLYYHRDQDGVCSAALLMKFYHGFKTVTKKGPRFTKEALNALIRKKPNLVVFVDLPVDQEWKALKEFQEKVPSAKIVIIDHHVYEKNMNSENIVHVNPLFKKRVYQSASYVVYNLLKKLHGNKVKRFVWIATIGAIGDYDLSDSQDLIKECRENYPHLIGKNPHNSELSNAAKLLGATITLKNWKGADEVLRVLSNAESYEDFSSIDKFRKYEKEVDKEFRRVLETAKREKYPEANLIIFTIETEMSMTSKVSNHLSEKYPDNIIAVRKKSNNEWKFSVRFQNGKINLGKIVKRVVSGIGTGGGHPKAAAGIVDDWDAFKKRFIDELKNIK